MSSARQQLLEMITDPDSAYTQDPTDLLPLQLRAAQDLFQQRREQIPLVGRRADDAGLTEVRSMDDLVPLLFAHTVYKSYPPSFIEQGRWDRMLQWLNTLSVEDVSRVDVAGVNDVDEWIDRLWAHGHVVLATSGSSGKCSFLNHTRGDIESKKRHFKYTVGWPFIRSSPTRTVFWLGPLKGPNSAIEAGNFNAENWGRPGGVFALTDQALKISEVSQMATMRKKMAEGSATPDEIAAFEANAQAKGLAGRAALDRLIDELLDRRHEPLFISGMWAQHMAIIERARARGIGDGEFHPETIMNAGGGVKGMPLPADYKAQVQHFYGKVITPGSYGMTEMAQLNPRCEAGRYHRAPGMIWLILNKDGDRLVRPEEGINGVVEGRFGFLDLLYEGRWGGLITGDKVTVDFAERCPCGRPGPTLLDNITRFAEAGEDDHIGCAGTIDGYIRGALNA
ncbi:hypothetical protein [Pseudomonas citronellolis]|uniref:hypothetical protein n=1 Tax=Pseudomonas citronellolis TaxID=53408 RepID=UPI0021BFA95D|nr:hypothetical protein [Pseudomonas citronellolis]UXJ50240.1 hypothetical protein N5P21_19845 [Pseudomonas citronellolis]